MTDENVFQNFFKRSISILNKHNIEYVIVGGAILSYFGNIRTTQDIDIMILTDNWSEERISKLIEELNENDISITKKELTDSFSENLHVSAFDTRSWLFRLDLKKINTDIDLSTFKNRLSVNLYDEKTNISRPESLIAIKISTGFQSNTDLEDILFLIETQDLNVDLLLELLDLVESKPNLCEFLLKCGSTKCLDLQSKLDCK